MFERFTKPARPVVLDAVKAADRSGQRQVRPEHLLLGVAVAEDELGARVLAGFGLDATALEQALTSRERRARLSDLEIAALRAVGIDADEVFRRIEEAFGDPDWFLGGDDDARRTEPRLLGRCGGGRFHADAKRVMEQSLRQAVRLKHRSIGTEHLLLGLLAIPQPPLADVLTAHGVTYQQARRRVLDALRPAHPH
jgi:ATP-dependent Clp protease ATP-binding subunit ClpA